jgi:hypothetical protein
MCTGSPAKRLRLAACSGRYSTVPISSLWHEECIPEASPITAAGSMIDLHLLAFSVLSRFGLPSLKTVTAHICVIQTSILLNFSHSKAPIQVVQKLLQGLASFLLGHAFLLAVHFDLPLPCSHFHMINYVTPSNPSPRNYDSGIRGYIDIGRWDLKGDGNWKGRE